MQLHVTKMLMEAYRYCVISAKLFENDSGICFSLLGCLPGTLPGTFWQYHGISEFVSIGYPPKRRAAVLDE